ncbi:MAG: NUDIX domain-containing protein [Firmicutes bacterium]|nr:NUDIX domain-containing protein [Bacillota bacterium]
MTKEKADSSLAGKYFWIFMTVTVSLELVIGLAAILLVPVSRPTSLLPEKGQAIYLLHAVLGFFLALGGLHVFSKAILSRHRYKTLTAIGLLGIFLAGIGGGLTAVKELRLLGMGIMLVGTPIAFFAYLTPLLADDIRARDAGGSEAIPEPSDTTKWRNVARVVLVDPSAAVLLLSAVDPEDTDRKEFWYTPGGGAKRGEDIKEAARREVFEETGYRMPHIEHDPLLERKTAFRFAGKDFYQFEKYFFVRTERFEVNPQELTALEKRSMTGARWWRIDELLSSNATVYPMDLSKLVADWLITQL